MTDSTPHKQFSSKEALAFGWKTFSENIGLFLGIFGVSIVVYLIPYLNFIAAIIIQLGLLVISLKLVDGGKTEFAELFNHYRFFFTYLLSAVVAGILAFVGFMLLVIPGAIVCIAVQFYGYLIVEKNLGPIAALKRSAEITRGARWQLLVFGIILACINIVGMLALVVGLVATIPTTMIAHAYVYRKLERQTDGATSGTQTSPAPAAA